MAPAAKPMLTDYTEVFDLVDQVTAHAIKQAGGITCRKGCFHCCRERCFATREEAAFALQKLSPEQLGEIRRHTKVWLDRFLAGNFQAMRDDGKNFTRYRQAMLWCPLLGKDGTCTVYDRRPAECRWFMTTGPANACHNEELRPGQKFMVLPDLVNQVLSKEWEALEPGDVSIRDHLGIQLAYLLLDVDVHSLERMTIQRNGEEVSVMTYDSKDDLPAPCAVSQDCAGVSTAP
jgi:Fe-S-cluster containining protein